jgi:hypothetical protein
VPVVAAILLGLVLVGQKPGDHLIVMDREGHKILSCPDEQTFRVLQGSMSSQVAMEKVPDKLVLFEPYTSENSNVQIVEFLADAPPDLAKVRVLTGPNSGKVVFLTARFLLTSPEAARAMAEIKDREKQDKKVPDKKWFPQPGDHAVLYREDKLSICITTDMFAFEECFKFSRANDKAGMEDMVRRKRLALADSGTSVLVIELHVNRFIADGTPAIELRILDGEFKDQKAWVRQSEVARLIDKPFDPVEEKEKKDRATLLAKRKAKEDAAEKAATPAARAASLLTMGKNFEKSGKPRPALDAYRKVVADFKGTPSATEAAGRIKVLEGK